jgi:Ca2+-binding RTX toxin-like protein
VGNVRKILIAGSVVVATAMTGGVAEAAPTTDGNDVLIAPQGNDILIAPDGNDILIAPQGNDILIAPDGNDSL